VTAVACLRVAVEADRTGLSPAVLGPLVAKFSSAYLETRWLWPRKFAPLTHYSFLLTDPRADELDVQELARLSDELQVKLFGEAEEGEVGLLLFEGPPDAVTAFAAMDAAAVARAMDDPSLLPPGGKISRIVPPDQVIPVASSPHEPEPEFEREHGPDWVEQHLLASQVLKPENLLPMPQLEGVQGVYFTPRAVFVGDVISSTPGTARNHLSVVEGPGHMPSDPEAFDADCLETALRYMQRSVGTGTLFIPVCYSNLVRTSRRAAYEERFSALPPERKARLAATVYDAPRAPSFTALAQLRTTLLKYFGAIDLRITDPGFEVEKLAPRAVTSVTFMLPHAEPRARLAALRRFVDRMPLYKQKQIWPGVTNVRNRTDLEACVAAHVPFVTGPGVCRMQILPVGGQLRPLEELPVLAA
jgi:hypothetical protein